MGCLWGKYSDKAKTKIDTKTKTNTQTNTKMLQQITRQTRDKYQEKLRTNNEVPHLSKSQKSRRYGAFCLSVWPTHCPRGSIVVIIILLHMHFGGMVIFSYKDLTSTLFVGGEAPYVRFDIWRPPNTISNNSEGQARKMALVGFPKEGTFSLDHFLVLTLH